MASYTEGRFVPKEEIEPAGPQDEQAKKAQEERHAQRQRDFEQAKRGRESGQG